MVPHKCPVCSGVGNLDLHFYPDVEDILMEGIRARCRTCKGTGVIWEEGDQLDIFGGQPVHLIVEKGKPTEVKDHGEQ